MIVNIRNLFCYLVAKSLFVSGSVKKAKERALNTKCILSVYFHKPSKQEFERCIKWFRKNKFKFISTTDLDRIINKKLPFPKGAVLLTVDDGWESNNENVISLANRYQVPVTIFISTEPVEEGNYWWSYIHKAQKIGMNHISIPEMKNLPNEKRLATIEELKEQIILPRSAMTIEDVKNASDTEYVTIGGHTDSHPILTNCSEVQVYKELEISKQKLENWTGKEVRYFAYPNGDYSFREVEILKTLKYRIGFSTNPLHLTPDILNDRYVLPRFGFLEGASFSENICRMVGIWHPLMSKFRVKPQNQKKDVVPYHGNTTVSVPV